MRLKHGVSIAEIARSTRVTSGYLIAMESDDFSQLPPPVFTRGFIRAFCTALGESPETVLALYDQRSAPHRPRQPVPRRAPPGAVAPGAPMASTQPRGRSAVFVSFILLVGLGAALFTFVSALQRGRQTAAGKGDVAATRRVEPGDSASAPAPAASSRPAGSADAVHPPALGEAPGAVPPSAVGAASTARVSSPYRLVAKTRAVTWVRVRVEGGHATEENIPAGEVREWVSDRPFSVTVGNAGGVSLELNGRPLPPLGAEGAVVRELIVPGQR